MAHPTDRPFAFWRLIENTSLILNLGGSAASPDCALVSSELIDDNDPYVGSGSSRHGH